MKRIFTILTLAMCLVFINVACKKSYECSCHKADGTHEHIDIKEKKSEAESVCKAKAVGTYTACELE